MKDAPIGIFDSGVGGLTVANAVRQLLPGEHLVYFGDTAHLPYGDKSKETITHYSEKIAGFLLEEGCKAIVIACNTASANAYDAVKKVIGDKAIVVNVIDPVVEFIAVQPGIKSIGVIGTKGTINSMAYDNRLKLLMPRTIVNTMATPLLAPMIEEGFIFDDISNAIIRAYLSKRDLLDIDTLILGCTHYPIIKNQIAKFYNFDVDVVDSSKVVALYLQKMLRSSELLNNTSQPKYSFFVSDYTDYFKTIAKLFFEEEVELTRLNIWK